MNNTSNLPSYICRECRKIIQDALFDEIICPKCGEKMYALLYDVDKWNNNRVARKNLEHPVGCSFLWMKGA